MPHFDECFVVGTAAEVTPVREIDGNAYTRRRNVPNAWRKTMTTASAAKSILAFSYLRGAGVVGNDLPAVGTFFHMQSEQTRWLVLVAIRVSIARTPDRRLDQEPSRL